jgi:nucleoside-diphosphate kinase
MANLFLFIRTGATNPSDALPGTIRGDYCVNISRNLIHGSDTPEAAELEIRHWFSREEVADWAPSTSAWLYD